MKSLSGFWSAVHAEMKGQDITSSFQNERMEINDSVYKIWSGDAVSDSGLLTFMEDESALDIRGVDGPNKGKLFKCIYNLEDDFLLICYSQADRPNNFKTTNDDNFILIKWIKK